MLTERINAHLRELSEADRCIWRYIDANRAAASRSSIHELARACAVSSASVVRFAQKLGFDGFGEMKACAWRLPLPQYRRRMSARRSAVSTIKRGVR